MKKWWNWVLGFALFCLLFFAIPLTLTREKSVQELKPMFDDYIRKFNKSYRNPEEYETRFQHFVVSVREIDKLNAGSRGPEHTRARYGLTKLSDMSQTEYKEIHLSDERIPKPPHLYGKSWSRVRPSSDVLKYDNDVEDHRDHHRRRTSGSESHNNVYSRRKRVALPLQVDWRTKGVISPIKDQGLCGACWAFSTVGIIEAMAAMDTGELESLSVQEVIDCAGLGNSGCAGGDICLLLDWLLLTNTSVVKEKEYPLRLSNGVCQAKQEKPGVRIKSFTCNDFVDSEDSILEALATHGPVSVAVNAITWQHYLGGVIQYHCSGARGDLNHAVQLIGYNLSADVPYYIAKNSWSKEFGNDGYLNLAIGSNICGVANEVATVTVR